MEIEEKIVQKDGEKGALQEMQRRNGSLPCFVDGQGRGVGDGTGWAPDGGVGSSFDPSCPSDCPAAPSRLNPGDGPVYYNKKSHWVGWTSHSP